MGKITAPNVTCTTGINGDEQESNFMNAALSTHGNLAVSIAVRPTIPPDILEKGEGAVAMWLVDKLGLLGLDFETEVQIGQD